jgi:biopolymer transport protein ExbB
MHFRKLLLAAALALSPVVAFAWPGEWSFRKEITLDLTPTGADIAGTPLEVPVLVRLHLGNFGYFSDTKPDGSDIRFLAGDDKTPLKFHVERFDATNQMAFLWVRVPTLAGGTNTEKLYMYYGNPGAPAAADPAGTYDANQVLVYHFGGEAGPPVDATAYGNNPSVSSAESLPASLIAGGAKFNGAQSISVPSSASLRVVPSRGATFSSWVRIREEQATAHVIALEDSGASLVLGINGMHPFARLTRNASAPIELQGTAPLSTEAWHHVALKAGAGRFGLLVDGVEVAGADIDLPEIAGTLTIGASAAGMNFLRGELDEVQVANVVRSADWLKAAARGQGAQGTLVAYGGDAQKEGGEVSYFAVTMQNVTIDGWVVIVVLAVMFVIAVLVMINKAVFLSKVRKANAAFLKEFERLKGDPTALDQAETAEDAGDAALDESPFMPHLGETGNRFRVSTLYRLYHHGVQEMTGRVGLTSAGARAVKNLTPQAIEAIRATMDASLVRMTQKMQSQMVLLTIAISGGPFLGLLGTVVGVMITFAAIAASGDVNVNSIAPGIAAALAATVAGLAVAIPALFGYNWLNTKIKEINADMRVFVDEFVTRIAEHYC